ncbi:MAG: DUF4388 domain-containing protein [Acidobacteriota bacterium]
MFSPARGRSVSLTGTLSTMSLPDVLQWLATSTKTGTLQLTNGKFQKTIFFEKGVIISSSSNDPREYLGQFLLSRGKITEELLRKAMESQRATGVMLGKILVMVNALTEKELLDMLRVKAEESLFDLFLWAGGSFEFSDKALDSKMPFPLALKVEDVLLEGLRRYDELQMILKVFSPGDSVLVRTDKPLPPELAQDRAVHQLLAIVDGRRSLTDLCLELHASEFAVSRIAYELHRQGCLAVHERPDGHDRPSQDSTEELISQVDRLLATHKFDAALKTLESAAEQRPGDLILRKKLADTEALFLERAYRHYLPPTHIPRLMKAIEDLTDETLTPQEVFLVSRINGSWTIKDIVTISPMREAEALRVLKDLRQRGIIQVTEN